MMLGLAPADARLLLTGGGVSVLLDASAGQLPALVYWGRSLDDAAGVPVDEGYADQLVLAARPQPGPNDVDRPARVSILAEGATGWVGRPGLEGSRAGLAWSPRFQVTAVTLEDREVSGFVAAGSGRARFDAVDEEAELGLRLEVELEPSGLLRTRAVLTNLGDEPYEVQRLTLALPVPDECDELLDFAGRWGQERTPHRRGFGPGLHLRENRRGRTGADSAFVLHAGTAGFSFADGEVYAVHTAWSGNHVHVAERAFTGPRLLGGGELLLPGEVRLDRGQTYSSPWLYGCFGTGLDEIGRFHDHLRSGAHAVSVHRPVTLNVWEAVYFDQDPERLLDLAERAAKVGVERFVLDDGWFGARRHERAGLGDWVVSPDVWPDGLHPLVDRVRALGMEFGLWVEPEMVNPDSDVARAHPDWIMAARGELPTSARHQQVLNLAIPGAYDHVRRQLMAILDEYAVRYLKWDHNRDLVEAGTQAAGGRAAVHAQTLAVYRLLDELRAAHPGLEIESCSSGGGRVDLGILERTDRVWVSDCSDPLERQQMLRWTGQLVPPAYLGAHVASARSHTTGRVHDLGFRAGTALFGHFGIEWDLADAGDAELADLEQWIAFYRAHRELLMGGRVVRMDGYDDRLLVHGVVAPDRAEAIFALVTLGSPRSAPGARVRLRGLDPASTYQVRPVVVGSPPSGLQPPPWWGAPEHDEGAHGPRSYPGVVLPGVALERAGLVPPIVDPEQIVLLHLRRTPPTQPPPPTARGSD